MSFQSWASSTDIHEKHWVDFASKSNLDISLLYAIGLQESGKIINNQFKPHPFAIGVGKDESVGQFKHMSLYPESLEEAHIVLKKLLDAGYINIGVGTMQINLLHNKQHLSNPYALFDAEKNFEASQKVLQYCQSKAVNKQELLSCYSHGRIDSVKGAIYAQKTVLLENQHGRSFSNSIVPSGEINHNELALIWKKFDKKIAKNNPKNEFQIEVIK